MTRRLKILGVLVALIGLAFLAAGGYSLMRAQQGDDGAQRLQRSAERPAHLQRRWAAVSAGETSEAEAIMSLLTNDWGYTVADSDFDPNDPIVNTASEYMFQMATISYHVLHSTVTVNLTEPAEYNGETFVAGAYDFPVDGRYYSEFDRAHPIEGPARGIAWSPTALGLIGQLGVGTTTASALQMGLGLAAAFGAVGATLLFIGLGLVWATRATEPETAPVVKPVIVATPA